MIRVTHVIDGLSVGGAEAMLANLLRRSDRDRFESQVISLTDVGPIGEAIRETGVPVRSLGLEPSPRQALAALRLPGMLRATRPDLVQTWLYHADLLGGLSSRLVSRRVPVVWGIHRSDLDAAWTKRRLATTAKLCARVSGWVPSRIVCCSEDAARRHVALGYHSEAMVMIPNGFDLDEFRPDATARGSVRSELGVPHDAPLIGMIARFDPQKDHASLLEAADLVACRLPDAHFLLCGLGVQPDNPPFAALTRRHPDLAPRLHAVGLRRDIPRLDAALDVGVLSSIGGEAFPLAVGEAMACGVPCVVTDVGDAPELVADTGVVVPRGEPTAMAGAIVDLLSLPVDQRRAMGAAARRRVQQHYELDHVVARYEGLYAELAGR